MARRYHEITGLAEFTAKTIVSSEEDWKKFLHTAGHTVGTEKMDDLQWDFMTGNTIDLEGLMYMPEMSRNEEVVEALHQMAGMGVDD